MTLKRKLRKRKKGNKMNSARTVISVPAEFFLYSQISVSTQDASHPAKLLMQLSGGVAIQDF